MDKLIHYRNIIQQALEAYVRHSGHAHSATDGIEVQLLFDDRHDHYQAVLIGWEGKKRVYSPIFHLDIKNDKIWVQQNVSDYDLIQEIMDKGVPQSDIVLGFQSNLLRQYSGFALA